MAKKNKTVKELNLEFELLSERVKVLEEKECSEKLTETNNKVDVLEEAIKVYDEKIKELDKILKAGSKNSDSNGTLMTDKVKCKHCGEHLKSQKFLKEHLKNIHPKNYNCKHCDEIFNSSWELELHLKSHKNVKPQKCNICNKEFYFKWRLEKHLLNDSQMRKCCHYFNNGKVCPYEQVGCQFQHKNSVQCKFDQTCKIKLCQFKHTEIMFNLNEDEHEVPENDKENDSEDETDDNHSETEDEDEESTDFNDANDLSEDKILDGFKTDMRFFQIIQMEYENRYTRKKCDECDFRSNSCGILKQHSNDTHSKTNSFQDIIKGYDEDNEEYKKVLTKNIGDEAFERHNCNLCDFKNHSEGKLRLHKFNNHK